MIATELPRMINKLERKNIFITIFLALYVLTFYIPNGTFPEVISSLVLYSFLSITFLKVIIRQTPLKITSHSIWLFIFGMLGLLSSLYALEPGHVYKDIYTLFVTWIVSFSFIQYVQNGTDFKRLFLFYAYFPIFLVFYLFLNETTLMQGERLGDNLFGNANRIATYLMISMFCVLWFILHSKRQYLLVNIISATVLLYMIVLTGGRKYIIVPLTFFFFLMIIKNWEKHKGRLVLYLVSFTILVLNGIWIVVNTPAVYSLIGVRFAGLINFFNGNSAGADASTVIRYTMVNNGWAWFTKQPILGYGLNNFSYLFSQVLFDVYAHNNYIEILVDLGLVGFLAYYSFYGYLIFMLMKIRHDVTGLRNFFLAFMISLLIFELGGVTYQYAPVQIFIGLASAFVILHNGEKLITPNNISLES